MGKVVLVHKHYVRRPETDNRRVWVIEDAEGRPGWVVGERWLQDGWTEFDYEYGNTWTRDKKTLTKHCLLVCYWPTMNPVRVPMDGYELAPDTVRPYPPVDVWPQSARDNLRKEMSNWPRDSKGRWKKKQTHPKRLA